jgi:hypothetical protein
VAWQDLTPQHNVARPDPEAQWQDLTPKHNHDPKHNHAWITYKGTWVGVASDGPLVVSVSNVPGSKENIKGWVEAMRK